MQKLGKWVVDSWQWLVGTALLGGGSLWFNALRYYKVPPDRGTGYLVGASKAVAAVGGVWLLMVIAWWGIRQLRQRRGRGRDAGQFERRFEELLTQSAELAVTGGDTKVSPCGTTSVRIRDPDGYRKSVCWITSAQHLVREVFGSDSPHFMTLEDCRQDFVPARVDLLDKARAAFQAASDDYTARPRRSRSHQ